MMKRKQGERGQGLVEMAIMLPILLLLLIGIMEIGYGLRDYLIVLNASREGCRYAARGRYSDQRVSERVVSAGGVARLGDPPTDVPFLRPVGTQRNSGIIITHVTFDSAGQVISFTRSVSGVVPIDGGVRPINPASDSRVSMAAMVDTQGTATAQANALRAAAGFEEALNDVVVVEVFFAHPTLWGASLVPSPWPMHAMTEMRVSMDRSSGMSPPQRSGSR
jgi:hypothetical protein